MLASNIQSSLLQHQGRRVSRRQSNVCVLQLLLCESIWDAKGCRQGMDWMDACMDGWMDGMESGPAGRQRLYICWRGI